MGKLAAKAPALLQAGQLLDQLDVVVGEAVNVDRVNAGLLRNFPKDGIGGDAELLSIPKLICQTRGHY